MSHISDSIAEFDLTRRSRSVVIVLQRCLWKSGIEVLATRLRRVFHDSVQVLGWRVSLPLANRDNP